MAIKVTKHAIRRYQERAVSTLTDPELIEKDIVKNLEGVEFKALDERIVKSNDGRFNAILIQEKGNFVVVSISSPFRTRRRARK